MRFLALLLFFSLSNLLPAQNNDCHIYDLSALIVDCANGQYYVKLDFEHDNTGNDGFKVFGNGAVYGTFQYTQVPVVIGPFPATGTGQREFVVKDLAFPDCSDFVVIDVPNCGTPPGGDCEITNLLVDIGDCNDDGTYHLWLNFNVVNPGNDFFDVWAQNGQYIGNFPLSGLPLHIEHFPTDGGTNDVVKVCINDQPNCCKIKEFPAPDCDGNDPCEISNLVVETGDCNDDGTYNLWLNFNVVNPGNDFFDVWAQNGQYIGNFPLSGLPLHIEHFPTDGGPNDVVKVCINDQPNCCKIKEFPAPDCDGSGSPCKIYDLVVRHTPCICGQFFALLTFEHQNGGSGGFDVTGNGQNYGNFAYSTPQPIVIGPLVGDGTINFEFVVKDHNHPNDCNDFFNLGNIECPPQILGNDDNRTATNLQISPNPANDRVQVTAQSKNSTRIGQATAEIYLTDGRLVRAETVADGSQFGLDVSMLPAGIYRLRVIGASGAFEANFVKE